MFTLRFRGLGRGAAHTALTAVAAAALGAVLSASITHNVTIPKASAPHEIAPIDPTCTSSLPCIEYDNNGAGPGIRGISVSGNGLAGSTKNHSTSAANGRAGLIGNDIGTGPFNSGVHGLSVGGTGVLGASTNGVGVQGTSSNNNGVFGDSQAPGASGVYGQNDGAGFGVAGRLTKLGFAAVLADAGSTGSIALEATSLNGVGVNAVGGFFNSTTTFPALSIVGNTTGTFNNDFIAACPPGTANPCDAENSVFSVRGNGQVLAGQIFGNGDIETNANFNIMGTGQYLKNSACVAGCTASTTASTGRAVTTYAPMVSQPTIEDFGEAQLVNGQSSVRLDPKFVNVVEQRANYLVFITPEGEANTLYVTEKSMGGFTVRESHSGRSTIAFSYRIVAKPFGSREARLPMVELPKLRATGSLPKQARRFHP
jgi:hypothetical protein